METPKQPKDLRDALREVETVLSQVERSRQGFIVGFFADQRRSQASEPAIEKLPEKEALQKLEQEILELENISMDLIGELNSKDRVELVKLAKRLFASMLALEKSIKETSEVDSGANWTKTKEQFASFLFKIKRTIAETPYSKEVLKERKNQLDGKLDPEQVDMATLLAARKKGREKREKLVESRDQRREEYLARRPGLTEVDQGLADEENWESARVYHGNINYPATLPIGFAEDFVLRDMHERYDLREHDQLAFTRSDVGSGNHAVPILSEYSFLFYQDHLAYFEASGIKDTLAEMIRGRYNKRIQEIRKWHSGYDLKEIEPSEINEEVEGEIVLILEVRLKVSSPSKSHLSAIASRAIYFLGDGVLYVQLSHEGGTTLSEEPTEDELRAYDCLKTAHCVEPEDYVFYEEVA